MQYAAADDMYIEEQCTENGWSATIVDSEGNPLPNVRVLTMAKMSSTSPEEIFYTDENGIILIPFDSDTGFVQISKGGYNDKKLIISCTPSTVPFSPPNSFDIDNAVLYSNYSDPNFGFTIEYPKSWDMENEFIVESGVYYPVIFYDDIDAYYTFVEIRYAEQEIWVPLNNDAEELEEMTSLIELGCDQNTFESYGFECKNFKHDFSRVIETSGQKHFEIKYSWELILDDNSSWDTESILRVIPAQNGNWYLYTETQSDVFENHEEILYRMLDSFSLPSSEVLLYESFDSFFLEESQLLDNEKYGFSMMMPAGWGKSDREFDLGGLSATAFYPKEFSGSFSPQILSLVLLTEDQDVSEISKNKDLKNFSDSLINGMSEYGNFEPTFENLETFESMVKITIRADGKTINPGFASIPIEFELIGWMSENGRFHFLIYMAEKQDFNNLYPDFRISANSFEFASELPESSSITPSIPEWVRNNAGWWANDVISESDFIVGIEHLIRTNVIQVEFSSVGEKNDSPLPLWIKNNAKWWSEEQISDEDFLQGIQFLIEHGLVTIENPNKPEIETEST